VEGPFGEWTGYYGRSPSLEPVLRVHSVKHRNKPIMLGNPPVKGGRLCTHFIWPTYIWDELEKAGVPDVRGVWCNEHAGSHLIIIVAIKQRYPGHARQAGLLATGCQSGARLGRLVIVVDEDIDPSNTSDVIWALGTRCDPERSIEIIRRCWTSPIDPAIHRTDSVYNSRAIIDACKPYEWKDEFPKVVEIGPELKRTIEEKWAKELQDILE
jgi:4-hydroxy-3-polyprenylbenzoate decarboxylase